MAELFKNIYTKAFFDGFAGVLQQLIPGFKKSSFMNQIYDSEWENRELKQRMRHITEALKSQMSSDYSKNVNTLLKIIHYLSINEFKEDSLEFMFLPDFIELYGIGQYDVSIHAIEEITQFTSCEFAIRPFIIRYPEKTMQQMLKWSKHKHPMVRRLSSEGCRPRLPWAMAIPSLKANPEPVIPILEELKNDQSESVRRSVANNLNDISKDNPDKVIELVKKWKGKSKETDWLIKHACRTLLKQGNQEALGLFGFGSVKEIDVKNFQILTPVVKIGKSLGFTFLLVNTENSRSKVRLEYAPYYKKANGSLSKKVFKISEKVYPKKSSTSINRKQSFKIITTRKFHLGQHKVSVIINGKEFEKHKFELTE